MWNGMGSMKNGLKVRMEFERSVVAILGFS